MSFQCRYQWREKVKISWSQVRREWGCCSVVTLFFAKKFLTATNRCAGALLWRRNQLLVLFWGVFPSDCIPKATKGIKVHFFIHSFTFMNELIMIPANFWNFLKLLRNINYEKNTLYTHKGLQNPFLWKSGIKLRFLRGVRQFFSPQCTSSWVDSVHRNDYFL